MKLQIRVNQYAVRSMRFAYFIGEDYLLFLGFFKPNLPIDFIKIWMYDLKSCGMIFFLFWKDTFIREMIVF